LTRRWVRHLQLLLALASTFILRSEFCRTHDHILLSQIWDSRTWRARSMYLYHLGTLWPSYNPGHWAPFPSPFGTHRITLEVIRTLLYNLEGQSTMPWHTNLRLTKYKHSIEDFWRCYMCTPLK
jgi:hypothetical protein